MVQIIPREEGFGSIIGRGLGQGIAQGTGLASQLAIKKRQQESQFAQQMALEEAKQKFKYQEKLNLLKGLGVNFEKQKLKEPSEKSSFKEYNKEFLDDSPPNDPEDILSVAMVDSPLANLMEKQNEQWQNRKNRKEDIAFKEKERERKEFESEREYHTKVSRPVVESANARLQSSQINKGLREGLRADIASGETSGFWPFLVEKIGLESFRNPESARFSNQTKYLFVDTLNDIPGARPNMFIERYLSAAQPNIGRSIESNLSVMDIVDFTEDVKDEIAKKELEIAKEDNEKYGYERSNIKERARERMGDYVNRRQEQMAISIRSRHENELNDSDLINELMGNKIVPGTYVTPRMMQILYIKNDKNIYKAVEDAKKHGLKMPEYLE